MDNGQIRKHINDKSTARMSLHFSDILSKSTKTPVISDQNTRFMDQNTRFMDQNIRSIYQNPRFMNILTLIIP